MGYLWDNVVYHAHSFAGGLDLDSERIVSAYGIMLGRIFYQELKRARQNQAVEAVVVNGGLNLKSFGETHFQEIRIFSDEYQFVAELYKLLVLALDHVSVDSRKLVDIYTGLFGLFFADKAVKDVQRVEKEVRVYLALQLHVPVLCRVGSFPLCLHVSSGGQCIVYNENYTVYGDFGQERQSEYKSEVSVESGEYGKWESEADDKGFDQT